MLPEMLPILFEPTWRPMGLMLTMPLQLSGSFSKNHVKSNAFMFTRINNPRYDRKISTPSEVLFQFLLFQPWHWHRLQLARRLHSNYHIPMFVLNIYKNIRMFPCHLLIFLTIIILIWHIPMPCVKFPQIIDNIWEHPYAISTDSQHSIKIW